MSKEYDFNSFRNRFLCRGCRKTLVSKQALDNHIVRCYEERIEEYETIIKTIQEENLNLRQQLYNISNHTYVLVNTIENIVKKL